MSKSVLIKKVAITLLLACTVVVLCVSLVACNAAFEPKNGVVLSSCVIGNRSGAVEFLDLPDGYYVEILATNALGETVYDEKGECIRALYMTQNRSLWLKTVEETVWKNSDDWTRIAM